MYNQNIIFNSELETFGMKHVLNIPSSRADTGSKAEERSKLFALLFEQFLLFDKIAVKVDRNSLALKILIEELGINKVEELIDRGTIIPVLWTPLIFTSRGTKEADGSIDHSAVIGTPPLVSGGLTDEDSDPEKNIKTLLANLQLDRDRRRIFTRKARDKYVIPKREYSQKSVEIVLDEYQNNRFATFGLPAQKTPEDLDYLERGKLRDLGDDVLETTFLSEKGYKSYDRYSHFAITTEAIKNIEAAYHVAENTSEIFRVENLANIRALVLDNKLPFNSVFEIRNRNDVKAYRKWINSNSVSTDAQKISKLYIDAIVGKNNAWTHGNGKLFRTGLMASIGAGIGTLVSGGAGIIAGTILTVLDSYLLDSILKGWNPRMFVDQIRYEAYPATLANT